MYMHIWRIDIYSISACLHMCTHICQRLKSIGFVTGLARRPFCDKACNRIGRSCDKPSLRQTLLKTTVLYAEARDKGL